MIPKEYQKSNLALELKAGKKRLEDTLHVLSDEQCERAGGTRSGSVMDVLAELVATEFLALMEVSDRPPGLPMNHLANADGTMPIASGTEQPTENKSVENLVAEFGMLRSAVIRLVKGHPSQSAKVEAKYGYVADGDNHNKKFSLCQSRPIISICPSKRRPTHRKCCSE